MVLCDPATIRAGLRQEGFVRLDGPDMLDLLGCTLSDWAAFADSWNDLGQDRYMADGGRYRRRRHAAFRLVDGVAIRKPHQPHFQSRDYNALNGDVQRWFEPVSAATVANPVTARIFECCGQFFGALSGPPADRPWHIEFHQFRVETRPDHLGRPTPEGLHRDGVDWVWVMLIGRHNVADGVTEIGTPEGRQLGRFTLAEPGDAVLLDDRRILHGVTPIHAVDPALPAFRDALVVTLVTESPTGPGAA